MNTVLLFCLLSFALTIDYSLALISLEDYWSIVGGTEKLSGVVFGLYDGFTIVITPLVVWLINHNHIKYKSVFVTSLILNMTGNILYGLAHIGDSWMMIIIGRSIAGIGATSVPLLIVYVAEKMSIDSQKNAIGYIKYTSALTRVIGPVLGILFSRLELRNKIFNQYTIIGWVPVIICLMVLLIVIFWKEDEKVDEESLFVNDILLERNANLFTILKILWPVILLGFVTTFIYWYFIGNNFIVGTYRFKIIKNQDDLGDLYYSGLGAFVLAFILFIIFSTYISGSIGLWISVLFLMLSSFFYLSTNNVIFYFAIGLSTFAYAILIPSINIQNNLIAKKHRAELGKSIGLSIIALTISQSVARFAGPSCFMILKELVKSKDCDFSDPKNYIITGCVIKGYLSSCIIFIILSLIISIIASIFLTKKIKKMEIIL